MAKRLITPLSRRRFFVLSGGAASAALLASCSAGPGAGSGGAAGPPRRGGTFTFASPTGVNETLDLHNSLDPATYRFISPVCSKLVEYKTGPDLLDSQEVVPDLAREWEVSEDGLTYTFRLRDDVTWHDIPPVNGRPFTSDDVVATFQTIIERPATHSWMFERVADIQAPDDHTVVIRMSQAYSPFLTYMAYPWNVILPREHVENRFDIENVTIGTGPFILDTYERGEQMIRVRNPNYYERGKPYLDELNHVVIPEDNAEISAFQSGRIDTTGVPDEQVQTFQNQGDVTLQTTGFVPVGLYLQSQRRPFDDVRVRRAVGMAINFERMGQTIYGDNWALSSVIPPNCGDFALSPEEINEVRPYDPAEARRLLAEAGHENGFDTTMMVQELSSADVDGAEYMVQDLRDVGINAEIQVLDTSTAVQRRINGEFSMAKAVRSINLPDVYLRDYESGSRLNYSKIADRRLDSLIEESRSELDRARQVELYHEIARYMETETAGVIYGVAYTSSTAIRNSTHDYFPSQYLTGKFWANVWVEA